MSRSLARKLVRYRNVMVALANAGITWVILIIAPLGLFAVINCTVMVFLASLATGFLGDLALNALLNDMNNDPRSIRFGDPNRQGPPQRGEMANEGDFWNRISEGDSPRQSLPRRDEE
ncbi:MAG: CRISPR-associated protein Csx18 [Spirulina sp.]